MVGLKLSMIKVDHTQYDNRSRHIFPVGRLIHRAVLTSRSMP
jgi:hypothetical protein